LVVPQDFAEDDGVGEVAVLKVYIGEELIVEGGEQRLDIRFVEAGALEDDDRAGDRAIGEVVEVDRRDIIPAALGKKSFGRSRAEGAFPGEVHEKIRQKTWRQKKLEKRKRS
jgi:hypothetical protein